MSREELDLFPCFCSLFLGLDWLLGTFWSSNARFWIAEPIYSWRVSLSDAAWTYFNKGWSRLFIMIRLDALTIDIYQYQYYWSSQYGIVPSVQPFTLYSWQSERFDFDSVSFESVMNSPGRLRRLRSASSSAAGMAYLVLFIHDSVHLELDRAIASSILPRRRSRLLWRAQTGNLRFWMSLVDANK